MTWDVDVSHCTFVKEEDGEEKEFTLFLYQVPLEEETINSNFTKTVLEENFQQLLISLFDNGSLTEIPEHSISYIGRAGELGYAHFLVEITNASDIATVQRIAGIRKFEISSNLLSGSVAAEAEYSGLLRYISADYCPCPNILHNVEKKLKIGDNVTVNVCTDPFAPGSQTPLRCTDSQRESNENIFCVGDDVWNSSIAIQCEAVALLTAHTVLSTVLANMQEQPSQPLPGDNPLNLTQPHLSTLNTSLTVLLDHSSPPFRYLIPFEVHVIASSINLFTQ
jgi:hypothetical protein